MSAWRKAAVAAVIIVALFLMTAILIWPAWRNHLYSLQFLFGVITGASFASLSKRRRT